MIQTEKLSILFLCYYHCNVNLAANANILIRFTAKFIFFCKSTTIGCLPLPTSLLYIHVCSGSYLAIACLARLFSWSLNERQLGFQCSSLRVRDGGLEDVQHAVTCLVPGLGGKLLSVQDDHVLQTVGAWTGKLLIIYRRRDEEEEEEEGEEEEGEGKCKLKKWRDKRRWRVSMHNVWWDFCLFLFIINNRKNDNWTFAYTSFFGLF